MYQPTLCNNSKAACKYTTEDCINLRSIISNLNFKAIFNLMTLKNLAQAKYLQKINCTFE